MNSSTKPRVNPTLDPEDIEALDRLARTIDVKRTWLARYAIKQLIAKYVKNEEQLALDLGLPRK